jgi:hypothetical protein
MLITFGDLQRYRVTARGDEVGSVGDIYFDDRTWQVPFFVVSTSRFLGRDLVIEAQQVANVDQATEILALNLTRQHLQGIPPVNGKHRAALRDSYRPGVHPGVVRCFG